MLKIGRYHIIGPVSLLRRLREPKFQHGQYRHYTAEDGRVGSWTITSGDLRRRWRLPRWLRELSRGEPRFESVSRSPHPAPKPDEQHPPH